MTWPEAVFGSVLAVCITALILYFAQRVFR